MSDMTLEQAFATISNAISNFDNLNTTQQAQLKAFADEYTQYIELEKKHERAKSHEESQRRSQQYAARKELVKELVPKWCEENLQPGMIIKVKAKRSQYRRVIEVKPGRTMNNGYHITGSVHTQHVDYFRTRDPDTRELNWTLTEGNYLTSHTLTNVTGVVLSTDSTGRPIVTPVLDLAKAANDS